MNGSMTALISAFARAYHAEQKGSKVFDDCAARAILGEDYLKIAGHMKEMAAFFAGAEKVDPVDWVVSEKLAPLPLARAAFCEETLKNEVRLGAEQYVSLGAGYDTFVWRKHEWADQVRVFLMDRQEILDERRRRAEGAGLKASGICEEIPADFSQDGWMARLKENKLFSTERKTVVGMMGLSYYLEHESMSKLILVFGELLAEGSCLVFDYMDIGGSEDMRLQGMLARASGELMHQGYDYDELEEMLGKCGFLIYEHLTWEEQNERFFKAYNRMHKERMMTAMRGVNLCMAVRKR